MDCSFHGFVSVRRVLQEEKGRLGEGGGGRQTTSPVVQNALDVLRMLGPPLEQEEIDGERDFLSACVSVDPVPPPEEEDESSSESEGEGGGGTKGGGRKRMAGARGGGGSSRKRRSRLSLCAQSRYAESHRKEFSDCWQLLLSLPMSNKTIKIILKYLPQEVIPYLQNPLLLADYLSSTVRRGGVVALLGIESLFDMILQYNLDYPDFFSALYSLCNPETFSARHRAKFMRLLHRSLQSSNIPSYVAASFAKKLVHLCLHIPAPPALFCLTQVRSSPSPSPLLHHMQLT